MIDSRIRSPLLVFLGLFVWLSGSALAGRGAAELSLDRAAVTALLTASLPDAVEVEAPALGPLIIRLGDPAPVVFRDGGLETTLPIEVADPRMRLSLELRFVPRVEPLYGRVRLECESAEPDLTRALPIDFAGLIEPLALPQRLEWKLELEREGQLHAGGFVQGVEIHDDRLVILLGIEIEATSGGEPPVSVRDR